MVRTAKSVCLLASMLLGLNANDVRVENATDVRVQRIEPGYRSEVVEGSIYSVAMKGFPETSSRAACFQKEEPVGFLSGDFTPECKVKAGNYKNIVVSVSRKYGVDWRLVTAVIAAESNFNPCATSPVGAMGLMQLMPATAQDYEVKTDELYTPVRNISAGVRHLKMLTERYNGNLKLSVAAYNAGQGVVDKYRGIPPYEETRTYVDRVLAYHKGLTVGSLKTGG